MEFQQDELQGTAISTLSGAATLGGVGVMTGGDAVVAFGAGFAAWKFLGWNKKINSYSANSRTTEVAATKTKPAYAGF